MAKKLANDSKLENSSAVHEALKPHFGYLLHKTSLLYKLESSKRLASLNIQACHFAALLIIESETSANQIQICSETGVDKATMVKTIDHLQNLKLVERVESKSDRRIKNLNLTKKGKRLLTQAKEIRAGYEKDFLDSLTSGEAKSIRKILLKLIEK